ncbi:MAG: hypothetical protein IPF57_25235 [Gammaproteobacteria bacterium]|nr:hypothetical protein [Gammaproteobacteria bacterium]
MLNGWTKAGSSTGRRRVWRRAGAAAGRALGSLCALLACSSVAVADDTEIFRATYDGEAANSRPKVLIVFDDSGSMDTVVTGSKPAYDPAITYPKVGNVASGRLYWATGTGGTPPSTSTDQWVSEVKNRCASSYDALGKQGFYTDRAARWNSSSSTSWQDLSTSSRDPLHVDCGADVTDSNTNNGAGTGSPGSGYPRASAPRPYGSVKDASVDDNWKTYRFYTANYMNWYHSTTITDRSRIEIAQDVITDIVEANPAIDFGLAVFNRNYNLSGPYTASSNYDGARIVRRIIENSTDTQRSNLVSLVDSLQPQGSTPLCESVYEAYRYIVGASVLYGNETYSSDPPAKDTAAESAGKYLSPMSACQYIYVIVMTDGEPQLDLDANSRIKTLTGKTCKKYKAAGIGSYPDEDENCLPELTEYMYNHDLDNDADNGEQKAITYTIGFHSDQKLLSDAATKGGGVYYTTSTAEGLADAFQGAITGILSTSSTFTAPSVAVDTFTRTESRNEVFFAMFEPRTGTDWPGNIKKLRIDIDDGVATLVDADGVAALDDSGNIADTARTFWSASDDGATVDKGGVGQLLAERDPDSRVIKTNTGTGGALQDFVPASITASAFGLSTEAELLALFGVGTRSALDNLLAWARGWTDSSKSESRAWILGDMLHSRPLVLNYGARGSHTATNPDIRIVVGTNAGFLHMFDNADGKETWAFFPKELAAVLDRRRDNAAAQDPVYGVDAPPVFYSKDINRDGTIDSIAGDKLYVYFGLRRGGKAYYALDVSNPDSPAFLWKIDENTAGFGDLGQSWSVPVVTYVPGYASGGVPKPVLIFGAGYDTAKDNKATVATADSEGRGVYIVDAVSGALVWGVTPADNALKNLQLGMAHSIPAGVTVVDSNGDELTDRIYAADTGGNIWRVDLPGNALPTSAQTAWRAVKFAALNTSATDGHAGDRRFFYEPDVVRTMSRMYGAFDAVLIGSGDRENPNATDNDDRFYMLRDRQTGIYATAAPTAGECDDGSSDHRCDLPLTNADLYDASANDIQDGTDEEQTAAQAAMAGADGWYIDLQAADGEKALARSVTIAGKVYFTTFSPVIDNDDQCVPTGGTGRLYALRLLDATAAVDFSGDDELGLVDRSATLGFLIPDTPAPHFGSDKKIRLLFPSGGGLQGQANPFDTQATLREPYGTYWYNQEY